MLWRFWRLVLSQQAHWAIVQHAATYPVHLHILELQTKVITLDEIDPAIHVIKKGLAICFSL